MTVEARAVYTCNACGHSAWTPSPPGRLPDEWQTVIIVRKGVRKRAHLCSDCGSNANWLWDKADEAAGEFCGTTVWKT